MKNRVYAIATKVLNATLKMLGVCILWFILATMVAFIVGISAEIYFVGKKTNYKPTYQDCPMCNGLGRVVVLIDLTDGRKK